MKKLRVYNPVINLSSTFVSKELNILKSNLPMLKKSNLPIKTRKENWSYLIIKQKRNKQLKQRKKKKKNVCD